MYLHEAARLVKKTSPSLFCSPPTTLVTAGRRQNVPTIILNLYQFLLVTKLGHAGLQQVTPFLGPPMSSCRENWTLGSCIHGTQG